MAYGKQKDERPKKAKRLGSLWKVKADESEGGKVVLSGYLDLGIDASIKIRIEKATVKKSEKSPEYILTAMVTDWGGPAQATASPNASAPPEDDIPF